MRDFAALFSGPLRQLPDVSRPLLPRPVGLVRPCSMLSILSWNLLAPPYMRRQHDAESEAEWTSFAEKVKRRKWKRSEGADEHYVLGVSPADVSAHARQ